MAAAVNRTRVDPDVARADNWCGPRPLPARRGHVTWHANLLNGYPVGNVLAVSGELPRGATTRGCARPTPPV